MARNKVSLVDAWTLAKNFSRGDIVSRYSFLTGGAEDIVGTVTAVLPGIGFVDVEFPWGNERVSADELLRLNPQSTRYLPSTYDTSYAGWDIDQSRIEDGTATGYSYANPKRASVEALAVEYDRDQRTLRVAAQQCKHSGLNDVDAFETISRVHSAPDHEVRSAVASVYKNALYWYGQGRKYRMNQGELDDGLPNCPKCKANLRKTTYKKRTKLYVCPDCFFCIKPSDIHGLPSYIQDEPFSDDELGDDIYVAALKEAHTSVKVARWDALKKQALKELKASYPQAKKWHEAIAAGIVMDQSNRMNVHEETMQPRELRAAIKAEIFDMAQSALREAVGNALRKHGAGLKHPDDAAAAIYGYLQAEDPRTLINVVLDPNHKEWKRLIALEMKMDLDRDSRRMVGQSITPARLHRTAGKGALHRIYQTVRKGSNSPGVVSRFKQTFRSSGLEGAVFELSPLAADGGFDRQAYITLVDILNTAGEA